MPTPLAASPSSPFEGPTPLLDEPPAELPAAETRGSSEPNAAPTYAAVAAGTAGDNALFDDFDSNIASREYAYDLFETTIGALATYNSMDVDASADEAAKVHEVAESTDSVEVDEVVQAELLEKKKAEREKGGKRKSKWRGELYEKGLRLVSVIDGRDGYSSVDGPHNARKQSRRVINHVLKKEKKPRGCGRWVSGAVFVNGSPRAVLWPAGGGQRAWVATIRLATPKFLAQLDLPALGHLKYYIEWRCTDMHNASQHLWWAVCDRLQREGKLKVFTGHDAIVQLGRIVEDVGCLFFVEGKTATRFTRFTPDGPLDLQMP